MASSCPTCDSDIAAGQKSLKCVLCSNSHHITCVGVAAKNFDLLNKINGARWFCPTCDPNIDNVLTEFRVYQAKIPDLIAKLNNIENKVESNSQEISSLKNNCNTNTAGPLSNSDVVTEAVLETQLIEK